MPTMQNNGIVLVLTPGALIVVFENDILESSESVHFISQIQDHKSEVVIACCCPHWAHGLDTKVFRLRGVRLTRLAPAN